MRVAHLHSFNLTPVEARDLQDKLKRKLVVDEKFCLEKIKLVAGADVSYSKKDNMVYGVVIVLSFPELEIVERVGAKRKAEFPYIPGLLVFREGPALLEAFKKLKNEPDVIFFDGHGLSHPKGLGIASHLGVLLNKPSIGVAKQILIGEAPEPTNKRGATSPILKEGKEIGKHVFSNTIRVTHS